MGKAKLNTEGLHPSATFHNGENLSGHYINCSANPYDLRPATDLIVDTIHERLTEMPEDKPLVVLMGEEHNTPTHHALQKMVISRLFSGKQHFTFASEHPHNFSASRLTIGNIKTSDFPTDILNQWNLLDNEGQDNLCTYLANSYIGLYSPVSCKNLYAFCYHNKITSVFNDAAYYKDKKDPKNRKNNLYLDLNNPMTMIAKKVYGTKKQKINVTSREGMAIRNIAMAFMALSHAEANHSPLVIQKTGLAHVFGDVSFNNKGEKIHCFPYQESLYATYKRTGAEVLAVFPTVKKHRYGINHLPENAYNELSRSIVIDGISDKGFRFHKLLSYFRHREKSFIKKLQKESGGELEFFDVANNKGYYRNRRKGHAANILEAYRAGRNSKISP